VIDPETPAATSTPVIIPFRGLITRDELTRAAEQLETRPPSEVLAWASARFPSRVTFGTGFGMEGCVLVDVIARAGLPIDIFTLDTGLLFPETYDLWERLQQRYGVVIRAARPERTVGEQAADEGPELWLRNPDRCCELRKLQPQRAAIHGFDAWITAIRRDQTAERAEAPVVGWDGRFEVVKVNPLVRWTADEISAYIRRFDVPVNPMHERGFPSIGCMPCTSAVGAGEDPRAGRWRGRDKQECGLHADPAAASVPIVPILRRSAGASESPSR
jgi:phosphoadenylyl-sulfate reductase (thioredoxin)